MASPSEILWMAMATATAPPSFTLPIAAAKVATPAAPVSFDREAERGAAREHLAACSVCVHSGNSSLVYSGRFCGMLKRFIFL